MARRLNVQPAHQRASSASRPAGVFFCQNVPRTARKISTIEQSGRFGRRCNAKEARSPGRHRARRPTAGRRRFPVRLPPLPCVG